MQVKVLYVDCYYDGPISGVGLLEGRQVYFVNTEEDDNNRTYKVYYMTSEGEAREAERHQAWNLCNGGGSYDLPPNHKPSGRTLEFFNKYPPGEWKPPYVASGYVGDVTYNDLTIP